MMRRTIPELSTVRTQPSLDPLIGCGSVSAEGAVVNWVVGSVHSQQIGLVRTGVRLTVGKRQQLHVKWPIGAARSFVFVVGQRVVATIPAGAVHLEAGMFRQSKQRWNRWIGRIVLVQPREAEMLYTVKIHGENWTLKGYGPVLGARSPSTTWDDVNVVVDPQRIELAIVNMTPWQHESDLLLGPS